MNSEMVDRVARTIERTNGSATEIARAVIWAMREPTKGMLSLGGRHTGDPMNAEDTWRAMIDAALGEDT